MHLYGVNIFKTRYGSKNAPTSQALQLSIDADTGSPAAADWKHCQRERCCGKSKKTAGYLLVLLRSQAKIARCGDHYDPQLVKRSSEWARLQDRWAYVDETWHVYFMGCGTKLIGSRILNFSTYVVRCHPESSPVGIDDPPRSGCLCSLMHYWLCMLNCRNVAPLAYNSPVAYPQPASTVGYGQGPYQTVDLFMIVLVKLNIICINPVPCY